MHISDKINILSASVKTQAFKLVKNVSALSSASRILPLGALFFAVCAVGAVGVAPLAPDAADLPVTTLVQELDSPILQSPSDEAEVERHFIVEEKILRGDSLATLMIRLGIEDKAAINFIKTDEIARGVMKAKAGRSIRAKINEEGELSWLRVSIGESNDKDEEQNKVLLLTRLSNGVFSAQEKIEQLERRVEMRSGEIQSSLFAATDKADVPVYIETQMLKMFETNVDFRRLQRGDFFNIVYETYWQDGELIKNGRLISGEFRNSGKLFQAVWFDEGGGEGGYYSFDGKSLKKAFLKSPIEFSRVSSGFSMRVHPISGKWKRHNGIDFAASSGTPIRASADGTIAHAGPQGGYGNLVTIKHWSGITTSYAHMSRFAKGMKKGVRVSQGEVIGYVGSTGWSTGPHLHYEFRVNNVPKDPNSISIPSAAQLAANDLPKFRNVASEMSHRFELLRPSKNSSGSMIAR